MDVRSHQRKEYLNMGKFGKIIIAVVVIAAVGFLGILVLGSAGDGTGGLLQNGINAVIDFINDKIQSLTGTANFFDTW